MNKASALQQWLDRHREAMVASLGALVAHESPSTDKASLDHLSALLEGVWLGLEADVEVIENPERAREIERGNVLACFTSDALKSLGESVVEHSRRARPVRLAEFIDRVQDKTIREKLLESSLSAGSPDEALRNRIFGDTVRRIRQRWYREKQRDLRVRLLRAQEAGDQDLCKRLLDEKERLRHEQKEREG